MAEQNEQMSQEDEFARMVEEDPRESPYGDPEPPPAPDDGDDDSGEEHENKTDQPKQESQAEQESENVSPENGETDRPEWYNSLSDEGKRDYDAVQAKVRDTQQVLETTRRNYRRLHGQVAPLQRKLAELERHIQASGTKFSPSDQTQSEIMQRFQSEDWQKFKRDFPDEAAQQEAMISSLGGVIGKLTERLNALEGNQGAPSPADRAYIAEQQEILSKSHDDWFEHAHSPEYEAWMSAQTPDVQSLAQSYSAADNIRLMDMYKQDLAAARQYLQQQATGKPPAAPPANGDQPPANQQSTGNQSATDQSNQQQPTVRAPARRPLVSPGSSTSGVSGGKGSGILTDEMLFEQMVNEDNSRR